jgi:hypothetical protein
VNRENSPCAAKVADRSSRLLRFTRWRVSGRFFIATARKRERPARRTTGWPLNLPEVVRLSEVYQETTRGKSPRTSSPAPSKRDEGRASEATDTASANISGICVARVRVAVAVAVAAHVVGLLVSG